MIKVSVVIATYNCGQYIEKAIVSVLKQSFDNFEIIVVDDGSTDSTRNILDKYADKILYFYQHNSGVSVARNNGIKHAKGEIIAFLDGDDEWEPNKLEIQLREILKDDKIGAVGCHITYINEKGEQIGFFERKNYLSHEGLVNDLFLHNVIVGSGSGILLRRSCLEQIGGFNVDLEVAEDWELWLRISRFFKIRFVEKRLVRYRVRSTSLSSVRNVEKITRNEIKMLTKVFNSYYSEVKFFKKQEAFSFRFLIAAYTYNQNNQRVKAVGYLMKSFLLYPMPFSTDEVLRVGTRGGLLIRIILGTSRFFLLKKIMDKLIK